MRPPLKNYALDRIAGVFMSTKKTTRGREMRPIRSPKLAEPSDTAGLGHNSYCLTVILCVSGLFAGTGGDEWKRKPRKSIISIFGVQHY